MMVLDTEREKQIAAELAAGEDSRRPSLNQQWPSLSRHSHVSEEEVKNYYYHDVRRDVGNLAFGALYQGDIARYRRHDPSGFAARLLSLHKPSTGDGRGEPKGDKGLSKKERAKKTVWKRPIPSSASFQLTPSPDGTSPNFLPLNPTPVPSVDSVTALDSEMDDIMLQTKEFNIKTRERPYELQLWLDFAAFQNQVVKRSNGGRVAARSIAEKQVSILERALHYHPRSPQLLLALLKAAESICDNDEMEKRWLQALSHLPEEYVLWDAYLTRKRSHFAEYRVQGVAEAHTSALGILSSKRVSKKVSEMDVVRCALMAIAHLMNTGYTEAGIAAVRVLLEMNYFSPEGWPEEALKSMFEEFWRSGAPLLGDPGGHGWSAWLDSSFINTSDTGVQELADNVAQRKLLSTTTAGVWNVMMSEDKSNDGDENENENKGESEEEEQQMYADELDKHVDAALAEAEEEMSPKKMSTWLSMELEKDAKHWLAAREECSTDAFSGGVDGEECGRVRWKDISPYALVVDESGARAFLLRGCLHFFGLHYYMHPVLGNAFHDNMTPFEDWKLAWPVMLEEGLSTDMNLFGQGHSSLTEVESSLEGRLGERKLLSPQRRECLLNCIFLLLKRELDVAGEGSADGTLMYLARMLIKVASTTPCDSGKGPSSGALDQARALMKTLLAQYKDSTVLWLALAEMEGFHSDGSRKVASKILTSLLSSTLCTNKFPTIVLYLARLELGTLHEDVQDTPLSLKLLRRASPGNVARAVKPLLWLGLGAKPDFTSFQLSIDNNNNNSGRLVERSNIVAARKGYQNQLMKLARETDARGGTASGLHQDAPYVSCAAAFELLSSLVLDDVELSHGVAAALSLYDQFLKVFSADGRMVLLYLERCNLAVQAVSHPELSLHTKYASPQTIKQMLLGDWLQHCFLGSTNLLCKLELEGHNVSGLRRVLNLLLCRKDSFIRPYKVYLWCVLLSLEIKTKSPQSAVRAVFERATSDEDARQCSTLWRAFLKYEFRHERSPKTLHQIFLQAIEACPWSKGLWLDGLAILNGQCPGKELTELLRVMRDKELAVRTDVLEVVLAELETEMN